VPNIESNYTAVFSYNQEKVCEQNRCSQPPAIYLYLIVCCYDLRYSSIFCYYSKSIATEAVYQIDRVLSTRGGARVLSPYKCALYFSLDIRYIVFRGCSYSTLTWNIIPHLESIQYLGPCKHSKVGVSWQS